MKDNAITTTDGIEVYKHNINYYADEYIHNELEMTAERSEVVLRCEVCCVSIDFGTDCN